MTDIRDIAALQALYGTPPATSLRKVADRITQTYGDWIARSKFCVLSTVGTGGVDASPRGDDGPVVRIMDARTLAMPDWRGNNRLDSLKNIVEDGRLSLMFFVPGSRNVVRVNGTGALSVDPALLSDFARNGILPATVLRVTVAEVYFQCAKSILRSDLWGPDRSNDLPSAGDMLAAQTEGQEGGADYDSAYVARAMEQLW